MRSKKLRKFVKYTSLGLLGLIVGGCQTTSEQNRNINTTLLLNPKTGEIVKKTLNPANVSLTNLNLKSSALMPKNNTPKDSVEKPNANLNEEPKKQAKENKQSRRNQRVINVGSLGYSKLEVYTEFPVPTQYSPARVIATGNGVALIPATPQKVERVKISSGVNQIQGFVDYGPTINIPVQTPRGTKYIQQKSPMPMPIIDSFRVIQR